MSEWIYTDGAGAEHWLCSDGNGERIYLHDSEVGWDWPEPNHFIEPVPSRRSGVYRATSYPVREYSFQCRIQACTWPKFWEALSDWAHWHNPELGMGTLKRIRPDGATRYLDCIPRGRTWEAILPGGWTLRQGYVAATPWWYDTGHTTVSAFNGAAPVNAACTNNGDIPAWPVITITGIVDTPKLQNSDGDYIEIDFTTANADDTLVIDCRPESMFAAYYVHGVGAAAYKPRTSASQFILLPTGTHNVTLTATAGTAAVSIHWHDCFGSLFED